MADLSRYSRQIVLPEFGVQGQQLLMDSSVLVIGVGGLGSIAAGYLAAAGVGHLVLADRDRLEASNLHRQLLYRQADIGRLKTEAAAAQLRALNPEPTIRVNEGTLEPARLAELVAAADLVLDCTDNFSSREDINRCCVAQRTPLISGAAIRMEGQLLLVDPRVPDCPCYACWFGTGLSGDARCEDSGVLGPVAGTVGTLQALLAIQLLSGMPVAAGVLQVWDAARMDWRKVRGHRDSECPVCSKAGVNVVKKNLEMPRSLAVKLMHTAQLSPEQEVCGLVLARDGQACEFVEIQNVAEQPAREFRMSDADLARALATARESGAELWGVFHSHPTAPAEPSPQDLERIGYPQAHMLIASLNIKGVLEIRCWDIIDQQASERVLRITD